jgi:hypothetical protein
LATGPRSDSAHSSSAALVRSVTITFSMTGNLPVDRA